MKIDIHRVVNDGCWVRTVSGSKISLNPERRRNLYILTLYVNNFRVDQRWLLWTRTISGRLRRGGKIPWDKSEVWYVTGSNSKRYRFLYINRDTLDIGTRSDHNAQYTYNLLSDKKRVEYNKIKNIAKGR